MKNLEKQIINRLNKILNKYNLEIISKNNHKYNTTFSIDDTFKNYCYEYNLVEINDNTIIKCYYTWDIVKSMLLESTHVQSLFGVINDSYDSVKYFIDNNMRPSEMYVFFARLYNILGFLNNCTSYEELIIKMDLMGV
jgi:hypothetical protein